MNVHPSAHDYLDRNKPLGPTTAEAFAPEALYEIKIDVNGDAAADIAYRMRFSSSDFVAAFGHALEHTGGISRRKRGGARDNAAGDPPL